MLQLPFPVTEHAAYAFGGEFTQYPGIPVTDDKIKTITLVTDGVPSPNIYRKLNAVYGNTHLILRVVNNDPIKIKTDNKIFLL